MIKTVTNKTAIARINAEICELEKQICFLNVSIASFPSVISFELKNYEQMAEKFQGCPESNSWQILYNSISTPPILTTDGWGKGFQSRDAKLQSGIQKAIETANSYQIKLNAMIFDSASQPYIELHVNPDRYATYGFSQCFEYTPTDLT